MADLARIKRNVAKMASMNAPEEDIDGYIASEGVTIDDVRNYRELQPMTEEQTPEKDYTLGRIATIDSGATFGFGRKLGGLLNAIGSYPVDRAAEALGVENTPSFMDRYNEIVEPAVKAKEEYAQDRPAEAIGLELGSSFVNPVNKLGVGYIGKGANTLSKGIRSVGVGAGTGGISAVGSTENADDLGSNLLSGTATGSVVGGAIPAFGVVGKQAARLAGKGVKNIGSILTGVGSDAFERAYSAGKKGSQDFLKNMRGKVSSDNVVAEAKNALKEMTQGNSELYKSNMKEAFADTTKLNVGSISDKLNQLVNEETLGGAIPLSGAEKKVLTEAKDLLKPAMENRVAQTTQGLDKIRRKIAGIKTDVGTNEHRLKKSLENAIKDSISEQRPEYRKGLETFAKNKAEIDEIQKTFSLGDKASNDTVLRKLQSLGRNNVQTGYGRRNELMDLLDYHGNLRDAIYGQSFNAIAPRGVIARGLAGINTYTHNIPALIAQSPRLAGELTYKLGQISRPAEQIIQNSGRLTPYLAQILAKEEK